MNKWERIPEKFEVLNIHQPDRIKYRVEVERCIKWGVEDGHLLGFNYGPSYGALNKGEINVLFNIPLPIGKWKINEDCDEVHTIELIRKG